MLAQASPARVPQALQTTQTPVRQWPVELHISDVRGFLSCRRRWDWSSPLRNHLEPIYTPIFFTIGKAVHFSLGSYYESGEHPSDVFERYMRGAIEQLTQETGGMWDIELTELNNALLLGKGMLDNYMGWLHSPEAPDERWETIATEQEFGPLPLINPAGRKSNRIVLAGRFDGLVRDRETGLIWLREYKTAGRAPNPQWLELDNQATTYAWAAQQVLNLPIAGVHFRFLMKKVPEKPRILQNGTLSRAINSQLSTTYAMYQEAIVDLVLDHMLAKHQVTIPLMDIDVLKTLIVAVGEWKPSNMASLTVPVDDRRTLWDEFVRRVNRNYKEYEGVLNELLVRGHAEYFQEIFIQKTQAELQAQADDLWLVGLEMVRPSVSIYPSPEWLKCNWCPFKAPCRLKNAGGNYQTLLTHDYRTRRYEDNVEVMNRIEW